MSAEERLIPVTSEDQLSVGKICVLLDCDICGAQRCRFMIIAVEPWSRGDRCDCGRKCHSYWTAPNCSGDPDGMACFAAAIADGSMFLVDDGLTQQELIEERVSGVLSRTP